MKITLTYFAQVRRLAETESDAFDLAPGATAEEAIRQAVARHGDAFGAMVLNEAGQLRPSLLVLKNGVPISRDGRCELKPGDALALMSAVAGG